MKFKWLDIILLATVFVPIQVLAQASPQIFPEPQTPYVHTYHQARDYYQNQFGYDNTKPCQRPARCLPAGSRVTCSSYKYIPGGEAGTQVQVCNIKTIDRDGTGRNIQNVSDENFTVATGFIQADKPGILGTSFFGERGSYIHGLPKNEIFMADKDGKMIQYFNPTVQARTEAGVCPGPDCPAEQEDGKVGLLARFMSNLPLASGSLNPPAIYDEYFGEEAKRTDDPEESLRNYNEVKQYIMAAAAAFDLPPDMLFCLKHRESRETHAYSLDERGKKIGPRVVDWFPRAVSGSGAVGIGQFLPGTAFDINTRIPNNASGLSQQYTDYLASLNKDAPAQYEINDSSFYNQSHRRPKNKNDRSAYQVYLAILKNKNRESQISLRQSNITDANALENCDDRCDPALSVGLSAMYLRYILDDYGNTAENRSMNLEYKVFITGAYNQGPGHIARAIKGNGPVAWQRNLVTRRGSEVRRHMDKIRECMNTLAGKIPIKKVNQTRGTK